MGKNLTSCAEFLVVDKVVFREPRILELIARLGLAFDRLLDLEQLGVLGGLEAATLTRNLIGIEIGRAQL